MEKERERELEALNLFYESSCQTAPSNTILRRILGHIFSNYRKIFPFDSKQAYMAQHGRDKGAV